MTQPDDEKISLKFPKTERLAPLTLIAALFTKGESEYAYPLRMTFRLIEAGSIPPELRADCLQLMVNVPKKKFKRAVKRVRLRRLMREAWRLQRVPLRERIKSELPGKILHVGIVYVGSEELPFPTVKAKTAKLLAHLDKKLFTSPDDEKKSE